MSCIRPEKSDPNWTDKSDLKYKGGEMMKKKKNEPSKWEIELISIIAIGFVFKTVKEIMEMLDLEDEKEESEVKNE